MFGDTLQPAGPFELILTDRPIHRRKPDATNWPKWLAGLFLALSFLTLAAPAAQAETRTLKLYFVHTKERAEITFKRNGRYDQAGLKQINNFLRDWRRNEPTKMDPRLLDLVWETYQRVGARDYIHVVSAYRSPATNSMLRRRSKGVAQKSQHMLGKAMDFYIPGVKLKTLRETGLKMQVGGVGYYPTSGSPFVHFDVGNVRHWPKMSRKELVALFPNGKTLHVPSDGKPLPGYDAALASYESRKKTGTTALALASPVTTAKTRTGGLLATLFGGGADEEEDNSASEEVTVASVAPAPKAGAIAIVPPELANPVDIGASADEEEETPGTIIAALPVRSIPLPGFAPRPQVDVGPTDIPFGVAEAALPDSTAAVPEDMPFGVAQAPLDENGQPSGEVASNIPLPSWRPGETVDEDQSALVALAESRPRPEPNDSMLLASLIDEDSVGGAAAKSTRLAVVSPPPSPKTALARLGDGGPAAPAAGVKTTPKSDRAKVADTKPAPKPLVVAAQPQAARWALEGGNQLAFNGAGSPEARQILATAPDQVYAAGFQRNTVVAEAGRFTGKAVSFLPVARFETY